MVVGLPFVLAAGFVLSPALKMSAALLFSASIAGLAVALRWCGKKADDAAARTLLQFAAGAVFAGMVLSGLYAVVDFAGSDALPIPQMARTHGILNSVGFCLLALLGWLVESSPPSAAALESVRAPCPVPDRKSSFSTAEAVNSIIKES